MRYLLAFGLAIACSLIGVNQSVAGFVLFDVPGEFTTFPYGINDRGQVVGYSGGG
jgi:hypothetical protein